MAFTNGNTMTTRSGYEVDNTYIRVIKKDLNVAGNKIDLEVLIYKDKTTFLNNWRNFIPVPFKTKATVNYNRETDGVDEMIFVHNKIKAYLLNLFPEWDPELIEIVDIYIPE